jgi:hypothetical protein
MLELLFSVYEHAQEDKSFCAVLNKYEFILMIQDILQHQLHLCVSPVNAIDGDVIITPLLESFPDIMIYMFSVGRKAKL